MTDHIDETQASTNSSSASSRLLPAAAIAVALLIGYLVFASPGPWVGEWSVSATALAAQAGPTAPSLPTNLIPGGFGRSSGFGLANLTKASLTISKDGTWHGSLPLIGSLGPANGTWTANGDQITLVTTTGAQMVGDLKGRILELGLNVPIFGAMQVPFER